MNSSRAGRIFNFRSQICTNNYYTVLAFWLCAFSLCTTASSSDLDPTKYDIRFLRSYDPVTLHPRQHVSTWTPRAGCNSPIAAKHMCKALEGPTCLMTRDCIFPIQGKFEYSEEDLNTPRAAARDLNPRFFPDKASEDTNRACGVGFKGFTRFDMLDQFGGTDIYFIGDSHVRQLFLRLVFWLRGEEVACEHYFHTDALYWMNKDTDYFKIGIGAEQLETFSDDMVAIHYRQCFHCEYTVEYKKLKKQLGRTPALVITTSSIHIEDEDMNLRDFLFHMAGLSSHDADVKVPRVMVKGTVDMGCNITEGRNKEKQVGLHDGEPILDQAFVEKNSFVQEIIDGLEFAAGRNVFFVDANKLHHDSVNASEIFVRNNADSHVKSKLQEDSDFEDKEAGPSKCDLHYMCTFQPEWNAIHAHHINYVKFPTLPSVDPKTGEEVIDGVVTDYADLLNVFALISPICG